MLFRSRLIFEAVEIIQKYDHYFEVYVGMSYSRLRFKSIHSLNKFIVNFKNIMNDNVKVQLMLNGLISNIFRLHYTELEFKQIYIIKQQMINFDLNLENTYKKYSTGNQNSFVLHSILGLHRNNESILLELKSYAQLYKNYGLIDQVQPLLKVIYTMEEKYNAELNNSIEKSRHYREIERMNVVKSIKEIS